MADERTAPVSTRGQVLLLGGAGYIGSHVNLLLHERGYETIVLDNLVHGHQEVVLEGTFVRGNIEDRTLVEALFQSHAITAVMHFAAFAYVGESVRDPAKYYANNVANTIAFLDVLRTRPHVPIVFSSTCAIYGVPSTTPIMETHPADPVNPYGASKAMVERILADYSTAYGLRYAVLRYFNAAGADRLGRIGEWHDPETHLIPLVLKAAADPCAPVTIMGTDYDTEDGTCVRDYIHVEDLASAHILAMEQVLQSKRSVAYNLGTGQGVSVREIVGEVERVVGRPVAYHLGSRRPGDPPRLVADPSLAERMLGWHAAHSDLKTILTSAWQWVRKRESAASRSCVLMQDSSVAQPNS